MTIYSIFSYRISPSTAFQDSGKWFVHVWLMFCELESLQRKKKKQKTNLSPNSRIIKPTHNKISLLKKLDQLDITYKKLKNKNKLNKV